MAYVFTSTFLWTAQTLGLDPVEVGGIGPILLGVGVLLGIALGTLYRRSANRPRLYTVWVYYASVVVIGLLGTIAFYAIIDAAVSAVGLAAVTASTAGDFVLWGLAIILALDWPSRSPP